MDDRTLIRAAITGLKDGSDPLQKNLARLISRRFLMKVHSKYGDMNQLDMGTCDPNIEITNEERADVKSMLDIINANRQEDVAQAGLVKMELFAEMNNFYPVVGESPKLNDNRTIDAEAFRRIDELLASQVAECKTEEELGRLQAIYDDARSRLNPAEPELSVYAGTMETS